jgi:hypothetical protein
MPNDLRHHNIVCRETNPEIITVYDVARFVNTLVFQNSLAAIHTGTRKRPTPPYV